MEQHLSDYLFVSTYVGYELRWNAATLLPLAEALGSKLGWDESRIRQEVDAVMAAR